MLSYIELIIDRLMSKFKIYNRTDYIYHELLKKLKNDKDKKHKIENANMVRLKEKEKFIKFQQEIENKNNKILFIQRRKIYSNNIGKNKNNNFMGEIQGKPGFEDFMFDKDEYFNKDNKI